MLVILDATVFCADFQMSGNAFRVFFGGYRRAGLTPCIPQSVHDEVLNKYREECAAFAAQADKLARDASRVLGRVVMYFPEKTVLEAFISEYSARLHGLISDHDFAYLRYPKISHKDLVARALARRRPFRDSGAGYRDSLLWEALLEHLVQEPGPLALVTANTRDFWARNGLHPDLCADIQAMGLPVGHIRLFRTLEELNHTLIIPTLERLDDVRGKIENGTASFSLNKWVREDLPMFLWDEEGLGPLEPGHGRCRFSSVRTVKSLHVDAVRQVAPDQILLAATADVDGIIDVSADWEDYQRHDDVREFFQSEDNESFTTTWADVPVRVTAAFSLILTAETLSVLSSELDWYETDYIKKVELNPHPQDSV